MTSPVEAAENAALGRIDPAESLLLAVPICGDRDPFARIHVANRYAGFRYEAMAAAYGADPVEVCRLDAQDVEALAGEIAGSSPIGVDEVTARYLERLTRTAQGNPAGWSQEKK